MASELADVQEVPDVKAARRALIEYFTGNPDDEFDGPCSVVDAYAAAVRGEAKAPVYQIVTDSSGEHLVQIRCANCAAAEARIAAALDRQVLVVDGVEHEIYGTSAALEILGRALGVPEDAWKTVTIPKSPPTAAPADSKE